MANFCGLCGKKISIMAGYFAILENKVCEKCYEDYEKVEKEMYRSVGDDEKVKNLTEAFLQKYNSNETSQLLCKHINELYETAVKEMTEWAEDFEDDENELNQEFADGMSGWNDEPNSTPELNKNIGPFENQDLVYTIEGVRGRHIDVYKDKVVITTRVTLGSLLTHNATDGEKTIYYSDCIGVQFKESGFAIGYLQLETASSSGNNKGSNFFEENSFTYDASVISNERMVEVANYVKSRIDAIKKGANAPQVVSSNFSVADELLKLKQLLDMGVLSQEEFDAQKQKLLNN